VNARVFRRELLLVAPCAVLAACPRSGGGSHAIDGAFTFLTTDNLGGEDDDPAVAVDANGAIHVVWFSDRDGTKDLYYVRSTSIDLAHASIAWTDPVQITHLDPASFPPPTQGDNYPALCIDADGMVNVAWHRWNLANESHIDFLRSDGTPAGWASAVEVPVTSGPNFDRFPDVVRYAPGDLRIYFGSSTRVTPGVNEIVMSQSSDDGTTWSLATAVLSLNTAGEHSMFPMIVKRSAGSYVATLDRWAVGSAGDALDPTTDVLYAESSDGETWAVDQVTNDLPDDVPDFVPALFFDHAGAPQLAWATTGFGDPAADIVRVAVAERALYPSSGHLLSPALGVADHSPRVVVLTVGVRPVYVMIWVRIVTPPHNQVGYRIFSSL
jgi:hypothetical protein